MATPLSNPSITEGEYSVIQKLRVPKWFITECIKSGDFYATDGIYLDWNKVATAYYGAHVNKVPPPGRENQWRGFPKPILPSHDPTTILPKPPQPPPACKTINGKKYTQKQLEHIGDAVIELVARAIVLELFLGDQRNYFASLHGLTSNENLNPGQAKEVEVGTVYAEQGYPAAAARAEEIIKGTEKWRKLMTRIQNQSRSE
jgi:hypothetical protein